MPRRKKVRSGEGPLGLDGLTPEEISRLSDGNERVLAVRPHGSPEASQPLPGPLRNPRFDVTPWVARPEIENGIGKWCPKHLQAYTEEERERRHYPRARVDEFGEPDKFCWACGRPCRPDGLSGMGHKGNGKPCPACGFRRKRAITQSQREGLKRGQALVAAARAEGLTGREMWAHVAENAPREGSAQLRKERNALRAGQRTSSLTELMRMKSEERAETLLAPYFKALDLEERDDWSPSTKLEFFNGQTAIAEKLLNRIEGLPVARHRNVDQNDEDVIPEGELSPRIVARLVAAIVAGEDPNELVEDAEFTVVDAG
jgi:hypothetical protein